MDRNTLVGLLLIGIILVGWWLLMKPSAEEIKRDKLRAQHIRDSIALVQKEKAVQDSIRKVEETTKLTPVVSQPLIPDSLIAELPDSAQQAMIDSIQQARAVEMLGPFAAHAHGSEELIRIENEKFVLFFSPKGGKIYRAKLLGFETYKKKYIEKQQDTLNLFLEELSGYNLTLFCRNRQINTADLFFTTEAVSQTIKDEQTAVVSMKAFADNDPNKYLEFLYTIKGNDYMIDFNINFVNLENVLDANQGDLPFTWTQVTPSQERDVINERNRSNIFFKGTDGEIYRVKRGGGPGKKKIEREIHWISFKQQFFSTALIAKDGFKEYPFPAESVAPSDNNPSINLAYQVELAIPYNYQPQETFTMQMYLGPNHYNTLKKYKIDLEDQIDLGIIFIFRWVNKYLIIPVFNFFDKMHLSYGLIILLLTIIIKLILSPITYKTFVSSAKMRILKPDIDEISAKFKPEQALEKQQAIMQLYRRAGVSPLSGCIPALLQMPILLAMFSFFPAAIELRQQGFLWANDLSTYDSILQLPFHIPFYGNHVSLFTLLMTATTMIYTWMSSAQMNTGGIQAQQMKIMMFIMPILFLGILNNYSAALSYYYFLSNIISILLTIVIRKFFINEDKLRLIIEENKKRPIKKSKWQQRIEEMQRIRQEQARQRYGGGKKK